MLISNAEKTHQDGLVLKSGADCRRQLCPCRALATVARALALAFLLPSALFAVDEGIPCPVEPTDMSISYGNVVDCDFAAVGDTDSFRFSGTTGEFITVQASRGGVGLEPCIEVFAPDGTSIFLTCHSVAARADLELAVSGQYTILLSDQSGDETGSYGLVLERIAPASPSAPPIDYGDSLTSEVDPAVDLDLYRFEGASGDVIDLLATRGSVGLTPCVELYAPNGALLDSACGSPSAAITTTLSTDGTHVIVLGDQSSNDEGPYGFSLQCISGPCVAAPKALTIFPGSGSLALTTAFDLTLIAETAGHSIVGGAISFDGSDITDIVRVCFEWGTLSGGGTTLRCAGIDGALLTTGVHTFSATLDLSDGSSISALSVLEVVENEEP